jgi:Spy/CpxP family protein refolding chaperone
MATNDYANDNGSVVPNPTHPQIAQPRHRRRWWVLLALPLAAGALSVSVARAHGPGGGPGEGRMGPFMQERMEHLLAAAGATDAQKAQIKTIWEPLRPQLKALHQQHGELRHQIGAAMAATTIDTNRIEQLRRQAVQTMDKISGVMTQGMVASAQVLTPDQRKIVLQKIEEHRGHHGPDGEN